MSREPRVNDRLTIAPLLSLLATAAQRFLLRRFVLLTSIGVRNSSSPVART